MAGESTGGLAELIAAVKNGNLVLGQIYKAVTTVFPQGTTITTSATAGARTLPAAPANFMTVQGTDGNTYKVPLYNP